MIICIDPLFELARPSRPRTAGSEVDGGRRSSCPRPTVAARASITQLAAAVQLARGQPGPLQRLAVEGRPTARTGWDRRASGSTKPGGLDDKLVVRRGQSELGERRGVDEEQALAGDREQAERRPDVPRAQAARVVVAGQPAAAQAELPLHAGVHHLGGAVRPPGVVVGPGGLHVGLVVQALEPVERVARRPAPSTLGRLTELLDRVGAVAEELVEQVDERARRRRRARSAPACRAAVRNE